VVSAPERWSPPYAHVSSWTVLVGEPFPVGRLINHLLSQFDYEDAIPDRVELPAMRDMPFVRPPITEQTFVP
jgi:hypothetical protein